MEGVTNTLLPARMFVTCRKYYCENGKESPIVENLVTRHRRAPVGFARDNLNEAITRAQLDRKIV